MKIILEVIPHNDQRYETVGDWFLDEQGNLVIRASKELGDGAKLVLVHELIEVLMCMADGIPQSWVDDFDIQFENWRKQGKVGPNDEPGDHHLAPYKRQHGFASSVERMLGAYLGVNWQAYANLCETLKKTPTDENPH